MPRKAKERIICEFYAWGFFKREGVFYADGRGQVPNFGKHSLGTRDREEALRNIRELDRRMAIAQKVIPAEQAPAGGGISIEAGWEGYTKHCGRAAALGGVALKTKKRYRAVRDKHQKFCQEHGICDWRDITKRSIEQYGAWLGRKGYADASLYLECTLLKQVIKWLIEEEKVLPESSRIRLTLYRSSESDAYCYSQQEVAAVLELCRGNPALKWLADLIVAMATTGMRIGELVDLRWTDLNMVAGIITLPDNRHSGRGKKLGVVRTTKGGYSRKVPIHPDLRLVLQPMDHRGDGRVFGGPRGGPLKPDTIRNIFIREVLTPLKARFPTPQGEVGFQHGRLHSFRHFFVSQAFLGGASEGEIRSWVGHTDSRIVERYRHLSSEDARRKMEAIRFFAGGGTSSIRTNTGGNGAADNHENGDVGAPGVPEHQHRQSQSAASAAAPQEESEGNGEQSGSANGGLSQ